MRRPSARTAGSGSSTRSPPDGHARLISAALAAGVRVALDTHGEQLEHALRARPDLIKINAGEVAAAAPRREQAGAAAAPGAAALGAITGGAAVVTQGADG